MKILHGRILSAISWAEEVIELAYEARAVSKLIRALCPEKQSVSYEELVAYHDRIVKDYKKAVK